MGEKAMDLSKCGGVCKGACKHYAIGIECSPEATYEPVKRAPMVLADIKEWMQITEGKGGIGRRDLMEWLIAEVERLTRSRNALEGGDMLVCGDCDGTGWLYNRVEGRHACTCMTEAEPYQILEAEVERLTGLLLGICDNAVMPTTGDSSDSARVEAVHILRAKQAVRHDAQ